MVSEGSGSAVPLQRVVAVVLRLANGREQTGTGYLVSGRQVLTAAHCTRDRVTGAFATIDAGDRRNRRTGGCFARPPLCDGDHAVDRMDSRGGWFSAGQTASRVIAIQRNSPDV